MRTKCIIITLFMAMSWTASAQQYRTAAGVLIDAGNGTPWIGPTIKHYFTGNDAIAGSVLHAYHFTVISGEYSYNQPIAGTNGLNWNIGLGPQVGLGGDHTFLFIRPATGLEYKIPGAPLAFGLDWRPMWQVNQASHFEAARLGFSFKYVF